MNPLKSSSANQMYHWHSGVISVQVINKSSGKYKLLRTIGSCSDKAMVQQLVNDAQLWIRKYKGTNEFDFDNADALFEQFIAAITYLVEYLSKQQKDGLSEDVAKDAEKDIQELTDRYIVLVDKHLTAKEKEIMSV